MAWLTVDATESLQSKQHLGQSLGIAVSYLSKAGKGLKSSKKGNDKTVAVFQEGGLSGKQNFTVPMYQIRRSLGARMT